VIVYIDNIISTSRNHSKEREQLEKLFIRLKNDRLKYNFAKREFWGYKN
jgi:hypothetical protein